MWATNVGHMHNLKFRVGVLKEKSKKKEKALILTMGFIQTMHVQNVILRSNQYKRLWDPSHYFFFLHPSLNIHSPSEVGLATALDCAVLDREAEKKSKGFHIRW